MINGKGRKTNGFRRVPERQRGGKMAEFDRVPKSPNLGDSMILLAIGGCVALAMWIIVVVTIYLANGECFL